MKKLLRIITSRSDLLGLAFFIASDACGFAGVVRVPADFASIQAAVNAAQNGDTVLIAPGVYPGQLVILNKSLSLIGSPGAIIRAVPGMSIFGLPGVPGGRVSLLGIWSSRVDLSGLTFDGNRSGDSQNGDFDGVWYLSSGGRVENCHFMGFRGATLASSFADAVFALNPVGAGTAAVNVQVLHNTFADNFTSIAVNGDAPLPGGPPFDPTVIRTTFAVNDNIITGNGPDASGVQRGIVILNGSSGEVRRNLITDHAYTGVGDFSEGILAFDGEDFGIAPLAPLQRVVYEGNVFRNNQFHLAMLLGDGSLIINNSFEGTPPGNRPFGIGLSGKNVLVAGNRFKNLETAVLLFGDDPDFGTYLGLAADTKIVSNGFCHVTEPIASEPLATGTKQTANRLKDCREIEDEK
jgi:hypothetical protein